MEERINYHHWYGFGMGLSFSLLTFALFFSPQSAHSALVTMSDANESMASPIAYQQYANNSFVFSPRTLQWKAVKNGKVIRTGHGSAGRGYCPDIHRSCRTPTGTYSVISKSGPGCRSTRYPRPHGGAPMPYCMFFSRYYAIHGSYDVPRRNASHGCIRVTPSDARWLNHNFMKVGSTVVVKPY